jgi:hypothetical protein
VVANSAEKGCTRCKWIAAALYKQAYCELVVLDKLVLVMRVEDRRVDVREVDDIKPFEDLIRLEMYTQQVCCAFFCTFIAQTYARWPWPSENFKLSALLLLGVCHETHD